MKLLSANHYWRIIAAGISYVMFGVGALMPGVYVFILALVPMDAETKQRRVRNVIQRLCRFYVDFMQFMRLIEYRLENNHHGPVQGHLVISNHSMLIDALFVLAYVDNLCCVVKSDLCRNPFTRTPVRLAGYVANNDERLVELAQQKLKAGENVLIFPEGTRNQYDTQLDFKRGAANIAVFAACPILPLVICSMPRTVQKGEPWYQLPEQKSKIVLRIEPSLKIEDCIDVTLPRTRQYRRLTEWLRNYYMNAVTDIVG